MSRGCLRHQLFFFYLTEVSLSGDSQSLFHVRNRNVFARFMVLKPCEHPDPSNYRLINRLPLYGKVLESRINSELVKQSHFAHHSF